MSADPATGDWIVELICCEHADGWQVCLTWDDASAFRESYVRSGTEGRYVPHERVGIISGLTLPATLGFHDSHPKPMGDDQ
jgi:hypothetical protein